MSSLEEFVKNVSNIGVIRRILFAAVHLPQNMPNYWQTLKLFSKQNCQCQSWKLQLKTCSTQTRLHFLLTNNCLVSCAQAMKQCLQLGLSLFPPSKSVEHVVHILLQEQIVHDN